jgi:hypothetical protein
LLNIGRMVGIMELQTHHIYNKIYLAHDVFNIIAYMAVLLLFYRYTRGVQSI